MQKSEFENPKYKKLVRAGVKSAITTSQGAKQKLTEAISLTTDKSITQGLFSKQIQGGALRYHLRKALSRSLNYDDFKIKLEKEQI
ncbi:hypothetical protein DK613_08100 [Campylobacter upsaliensis]|nr:hypothetical protein [Campylobacter upsaliensis]